MEQNTDIIVIVDMQNDFISGCLGSKDAEKAVQNAIKYIEDIKDPKNTYVLFTQDTHYDNHYSAYIAYENISEGRHLPISHCIMGTNGWCIHERLYGTVKDKFKDYDNHYEILTKNGFMAGFKLPNRIAQIITDVIYKSEDPKTFDTSTIGITIFGLCTDICVVSNALLLERFVQTEDLNIYSNVDIKCIANCCAGTTPDNHEAALKVMQSCHIDIQ